MMNDRGELERLGIDADELATLREAFAATSRNARQTADCPPVETIWAAARRELEPAAVRPVVDHMGGCGFCAEAWRMAMRSAPDAAADAAVDPSAAADPTLAPAREDAATLLTPARVTDEATTPWWRWSWQAAIPAAAFAVLLLFIGLRFVAPNPAPEPTMRGAAGSEIDAAPATAELPRAAFRLQWTAGPEGSVYDVSVVFATGDEIVTIETAQGIADPEHLVAAGRLSGLPAGASVDWQVTATLPDGGRLASPTFTTTLR